MLGEWEGKGREGEKEGSPSPSCSLFFRKDAIISSQEGGTEYIIRQCVAQDRGSVTHKATSCSCCLILARTLFVFAGKLRQFLVQPELSPLLLLPSLCHGLVGLVHPLLPLSRQSMVSISMSGQVTHSPATYAGQQQSLKYLS